MIMALLPATDQRRHGLYASGAKAVYIATDHDDIAKAVSSLGWKALKTSESHETGTDRLAFPVKDGIPVMLEDEARTLRADEEP